MDKPIPFEYFEANNFFCILEDWLEVQTGAKGLIQKLPLNVLVDFMARINSIIQIEIADQIIKKISNDHLQDFE